MFEIRIGSARYVPFATIIDHLPKAVMQQSTQNMPMHQRPGP
jgi:hypothetical protein